MRWLPRRPPPRPLNKAADLPPDVLLLVAATRSDTGLSLEIIRQQITPLSRYTRSPEHESKRMTGIWYPCTP